jgi:hypothetical protein
VLVHRGSEKHYRNSRNSANMAHTAWTRKASPVASSQSLRLRSVLELTLCIVGRAGALPKHLTEVIVMVSDLRRLGAYVVTIDSVELVL